MSDLFAVSEKIAAKEESAGLDSLTPSEQVFHAVWCFEAELNNGGFDQFFFNASGDHPAETVAALERIGASSCAAIVRRACALFPNATPSPDRHSRQEQLESITDANDEAFEALDDEFCEYPDDLAGLLGKFWAAHGG
jgi:hypothetical protein